MDTSTIAIETNNLTLRGINEDYASEIFREFDDKITTHMSPRPAKNIAETLDFIKSSVERNKAGTNLQIVILKKETQEFLGCGGLHNIDTATPELGIWIKKSAHGHGYGREAITALKNWADDNIDYDYILYPVVDLNIASRKIPESLGGRVEREYDEEEMQGRKQHLVEYRIYSNKK